MPIIRPTNFKPALLVIDVQEDFAPPNGSLAVSNGRDIIPTINHLLTLPFTIKIATKDFHPPNHISFASNHPAPHNKPFESFTDIINPNNSSETISTRLWPDHCIQGTFGCELLPELDTAKVDEIVRKGQDERVEMYSAFQDAFETVRVVKSGLEEKLKERGVTHCYIVGLAFDYCVKYSALDAMKAGFEVFAVKEGCRAVDSGKWADVTRELEEKGIKVVEMDSDEVKWLTG